ncbi:MAG: hypothetical protein HC841_07920, partial [Verrucomicrobiae bacterium]|nr:hypothetical protein [Verrucomicrobiae bacterium]
MSPANQVNSGRRWFGNGYLDLVVSPLQNFARQAGHPLAAAFQPTLISDPGIFDFYNKLLDGPNKQENEEFNQYRLVLENTWFDNSLGFEASYYQEDVERLQWTMLSDLSRLQVDINELTVDGLPNPNVGRVYVQETTFSGNRRQTTDLNAYRLSAFYEFDFDKVMDEGWINDLLGRHRFNAVHTRDNARSDVRTIARHVYGDDLANYLGLQRFNNNTRVTVRNYLSGDIRGLNDASQLNLQNISSFIVPEGGTIDLTYFNKTWIAPSTVSPSTPWVNPIGQTWEQAANPANYVGWTTGQFTIIDALSGSREDFDLATRSATLQESKTKSNVLSWQGYVLNEAIVATFGWREDRNQTYRTDAPARPDGGDNVDPSVYNLSLDPVETIKVQSRNWSLVGHLNRLPFLSRWMPFEASLFYNKGENFNPTGARLNPFGELILPPQGSTEEVGFLIATKDNRYSLRFTDYETRVLNVTSAPIPSNFTFAQFFGRGAESAFRAREGITREDFADNPNRTWDLDQLEDVFVPAWEQFERDLLAEFPTFVELWQTDGTWAPGNEKLIVGSRNALILIQIIRTLKKVKRTSIKTTSKQLRSQERHKELSCAVLDEIPIAEI